MYLKVFHLFNAANRKHTDLRDYEAHIWKSIKKVMPDAEIEVNKRYFLVLSDEQQTNAEARRIGKLMGQTPLGKLTTEHFYENKTDNSIGRSGKLFVEAKNINVNVSVDDDDSDIIP